LTASAVQVRRFASLVKFEHTVFALPFAFCGAILARGAVPSAVRLGWITLAMVGARSLAMALNRLIDAEIDARNPRTARRELPAGLLTRAQVTVFTVASLAVFLVSVWQLPGVTHVLWPIPVAAFVIYPYTKRFTWLCHFVLGAAIGLSPVGGWVAVTGRVDWPPFLLMAAVALWIGGFDVIYGTMDIAVDRAQGLRSLPSTFGIGPALAVTRAGHLAAVLLLLGLGLHLGVGAVYYLGLALVAALLGYENAIVHADDLTRVNTAFFTVNGVLSIVYLAAVLADVLV
jgi:4-hydroxybenzoate polyprenyltransferase